MTYKEQLKKAKKQLKKEFGECRVDCVIRNSSTGALELTFTDSRGRLTSKVFKGEM